MAAPSYTEDLTDITLAESVTGWTALGGGASGLAIGPDFAMQGTNCVDKAVTAAEKGQVFDNGATITPGANTHFFVWVFLATPGLANTLANRGLAVIAGTSTTAYTAFHVEGSNTYGAVGRVARCYPIRYNNTANTGSVPYRTNTGSPGANPQWFGATANITGTVKGSNLGVDAIRYGTGMYITAGDSTTPATFTGAAAQNDAIANRWGILTFIGGSQFELQGRFVVGQNNAGTATLAYFSDSNKSILLVDTPHSLTDFTQIIVDHASTQFYWTGITVEAAGTNNPGKLVFNNASTVATLTNCSFVKLGTTTLQTAVQASGCTWRQAGLVTQNSAILSNCTFDAATGTALLSNNINDIDGCTFVSKGTGHAIELTSAHAGNSYTLTDVTFTGFGGTPGSNGTASSGSTDAAIYNNSGGAVTINVSGGTTPAVRNGAGATTTVISGAVDVTLTVTDVTGAAISGAQVMVAAANATGDLPYQESVTIANSSTTATVTHTSHGMSSGDKVLIKGASHHQNRGVFSITVTGTNTYTYTMASAPGSNPTGTITATWVALSGTTNGSGQIATNRVFSIDQPVSGWARKSSEAPYFKTGPVSGTIDSGTGATLSALLIADE